MTGSDNERREREILRELKAKSKTAGDSAWQRVNQWSGEGDYLASDHGEAPQGARW